LRVGYLVSAAMPGILPRAPMTADRSRVMLRLEGGLTALAGERLFNRLRQLARLIGREPEIVTT